MAREHIENEDQLLIALGDTIFDLNMKDLMKIPYSALGTKRVDDPRRFGVVELGADNFIARVVEKPTAPVSNLAIVGIYKIDQVRAMIDALKHIIDHNIRTKNEFQLTDALMYMIENGEKFVTFNVENWFDCGKKDALLETNAILLKKDEFITSNLEFENTIIIQPVNIDKSCHISHSIIGPNVSIGSGTTVLNCIVKESIIGSDAELKNAILHDSLIGNEASLHGLSQSLNLGDSTEINFE
jgi:glucose-1-phosphate thymidylyltransferase